MAAKTRAGVVPGDARVPADARAIGEACFDAMYNEHVNEYYGHSDFFNFGYWNPSTRNQQEACENLMGKLLSMFPEKHGTVLDVACGKGATTRALLEFFDASDVVGINIFERQLEICRANVPGCTFMQMNATDLQFDDASFDNLICVEAAFCFRTRERFFQESFRVLRPGGHLVIADVLFGFGDNPESTAGEYRQVLERTRFQNLNVIDATNECLVEHRRQLRRFLFGKMMASGGLPAGIDPRRLMAYQVALQAMKGYILAYGQRPQAA